MNRKEVSVLSMLGFFLTTVVAPAQAEISIKDADAVFEVRFERVNILTQAVALTKLFINQTDAVAVKDLLIVTVPTQQSAIRKMFISNEDAVTFKDLLPVTVPTELSTIRKMFIRNEDAILTTTLIPFAQRVAPPSATLGDVDEDGEISSGDAILTLRFAAELQTPTAEQRTAADVDRDGEITAGDAILILRRAADLISAFPKLLVTPLLNPTDVRLSDVERQSDDIFVLTFTLSQIDGVAGGDLFFTYDPMLGQPKDIQVEGLSPGALSVVNTEVAGQVRVSFADLSEGKEPGQIILYVLIVGIKVREALPISLQGRLYNNWGMLIGEIRLDRTVSLVLPTDYALQQNSPNPFNPTTTIRYELPKAGHVIVNVYSLAGQLVRTLVDDQVEAGYHMIEWDGRDKDGRKVGSGIYLYRLSVDGDSFTAVRRMTLLK